MAAILKTVKSLYFGNGWTDLHEMWHGDAHLPCQLHWTDRDCLQERLVCAKRTTY